MLIEKLAAIIARLITIIKSRLRAKKKGGKA